MRKANRRPNFAMVSQRHQAGKKFLPLARAVRQRTEIGARHIFCVWAHPGAPADGASNIWDSTVMRRESGAS
jgi:hypothetical protein